MHMINSKKGMLGEMGKAITESIGISMLVLIGWLLIFAFLNQTYDQSPKTGLANLLNPSSTVFQTVFWGAAVLIVFAIFLGMIYKATKGLSSK